MVLHHQHLTNQLPEDKQDQMIVIVEKVETVDPEDTELQVVAEEIQDGELDPMEKMVEAVMEQVEKAKDLQLVNLKNLEVILMETICMTWIVNVKMEKEAILMVVI